MYLGRVVGAFGRGVLVVAGYRQMRFVVHVYFYNQSDTPSGLLPYMCPFTSLLGPTCWRGRLLADQRGSAAVPWAMLLLHQPGKLFGCASDTTLRLTPRHMGRSVTSIFGLSFPLAN